MKLTRPVWITLVIFGIPVTVRGQSSTFETPDITQTGGTYYPEALVWYQNFPVGSDLDGWTVASGSADVVRHLTGTAIAGAQSVDLNGFSAGTLTRSFATETGKTYQLKFNFSGNPIDGQIRELEVRWNGQAVAAFSWNPMEKGNSFQTDMKWESKVVELAASGPTSTVELVSLRSGASGPEIDNISFTQVTAITVEKALLLTWDIPASGPLGSILESAESADGPWQIVQPAFLNLAPGQKVTATVVGANAATFYRIRPAGAK